ncbi:MAG: hypothetical protein II324_07835 [Selenomonadales bacterium]|nr:hypothetical protein [Selenomonadales bacterium]
MELALWLVACLILKIVVTQMENKKRREEERHENQEETDIEWQGEASQQAPKRKLPFEIPTMREADPNAETRLPQADRIFIRREKTAESKAEPKPTPEPKRVLKQDSVMPSERTKGINPLYQARLAMGPTTHRETVVDPIKEDAPKRARPQIPTDRQRLVEGIILAEVLGKPKAYQRRTYLK